MQFFFAEILTLHENLPPLFKVPAWQALLFCAFLIPGLAVSAVSTAVKVDQVGYLPTQNKYAMLTAAPTGSVVVRDASTNAAVLTVAAGAAAADPDSGDTVRSVDFSALTTPGTYYLDVPGVGQSYNFTVSDTVYSNAWYQVMRFYYGQRCGTAVNMGTWSHAACHTADATFDPSSGKSGTKVSTKGWHDAGDYGKYSVNAGISTAEILWTYEWFSNLIGNVNLGIPESGNGVPDILNEAKWELDWWLTMQDSDGGVWAKVTTLAFPAFIMPEADTATRYIIGTGSGAPYKNTSSTADFAAVMAIAARVYQPFNPTYASTCLTAAQNAWTWASANPNVTFTNPSNCSTGQYGDGNLGDELLWAAAELFRTTGNATYNTYFTNHYTNWNPTVGTGVLDWATVTDLAMWTYYFSGQASANATALSKIKMDTINTANNFVTRSNSSTGYRNTLQGSGDYIWGSNGWCGNQAVLLVVANRMQANASYISTALEDVHYLFGRNTFDMSFVTNLGTVYQMHPHHRPSGADGITAPWPGMVAGGPNYTGGDGITPTGGYPARDYTDQQGAYASNEVALNWNSPWVFVLAAMQAGPSGTPTPSPTISSTFSNTPFVTATSTFSSTPSATPTYTPNPCSQVWRLRCGITTTAYTDSQGHIWAADRLYTAGGYGYISGTGATTTNTIAGTADQPLYQTERYGNPMEYRFDLPNGLYHVTLKFAEIYYTTAGSRIFSIAIQGNTVISNLDLVATAGANTAYDRDFWITVSSGYLDIVGTASVDNAKIDAIEVESTAGSCSPTISPSFSSSPTRTVTVTPTRTVSPLPSASLTSTGTASPSNSPTSTPSPTYSFSPSPSLTPSPSFSASPSSSASFSYTPSGSPSATPSFSASPSVSPSYTPVPTGSTKTATPSISPSFSCSPSVTFSVTLSPSPSFSGTFSYTPSTTFSASPSPSFSCSPSVTFSVTLSPSPSFSQTFSHSPSATFSASPSTSPSATSSVNPSPTLSPSNTATPPASVSPTSSATDTPSATYTFTVSASPTDIVTATFTTTAMVLSPTFTYSPALPGATLTPSPSLPGQGPPVVDNLIPMPNPGAQNLVVHLEGPADDVELRFYSVDFKYLGSLFAGPRQGGWFTIPLTGSFLAQKARGTYFACASTLKGGQRGPKFIQKLIFLK